jgi:hypothetical protein
MAISPRCGRRAGGFISWLLARRERPFSKVFMFQGEPAAGGLRPKDGQKNCPMPDPRTLETFMFRKPILALAAAASLGALAVSTTDASAFGHFGGGGRGFARASFARVGTPHVAFRQNFAFRRIGFPKLYPPHPPHPHWAWWWWHHHHHHWIWGVPAIAGGVTYATTPSYASAPATNTCNCLTKQYTQEGAVVFKDVCTNEMAMNPPAADTAPQATASLQPTPMQQGYLQPQPAQ